MIKEFIGEVIVIDMQSPFVFIGTLQEIAVHEVALINVDVHDLRDSSTSREIYIHEIRVHGLAPNRERVIIRKEQIVSVSLLSEVTT